MSENPRLTPDLIDISTKSVSWRKQYRPQLMNASFFCFILGAPVAYLGGVTNNNSLIELSFVIFSVACFIPLITQK